ncbi:hypothetical protein M426DRAFT_258647 [Hypoxylon sp. CI-4A]|nr:hypothetical protein M426DRAFT_258647 [Hypoxylon sp. CI-4A]
MQIPSTLIVQKIRPSIWLAAMEVGWAAFTFAQAGLHNVSQLWYTKTELAKRVAIFHMTAPLGSAFGGYLQAAVYTSLDGAHGLAGWRWLYIVCGCMTMPIGIATFFILPDTPFTTRSRFLTPAECELALERVQKAGKAPPAKLSLRTFKQVLTHWRWPAFVLGYIVYGESCQSNSYFAIWLKSEGFSVVDRNVIPTGSKLISAACIVLWGFLSDYTGSRYALILGPLIYALLPNGILAFWTSSTQLKEFAFLTSSAHLVTAIFYTWANEVCAGDNEERALVISSMNAGQYAIDAWLPIVIFPQTMAPRFKYGFPATFGFVVAAIFMVSIIRLFVWRDQRRKVSTETDVTSNYGNDGPSADQYGRTGNGPIDTGDWK